MIALFLAGYYPSDHFFEGLTFESNISLASETNYTDIASDSCNFEFKATARMLFLHDDHVIFF